METFNTFLTADVGAWALGLVAAWCLTNDGVRRALRNLWDVRS